MKNELKRELRSGPTRLKRRRSRRYKTVREIEREKVPRSCTVNKLYP